VAEKQGGLPCHQHRTSRPLVQRVHVEESVVRETGPAFKDSELDAFKGRRNSLVVYSKMIQRWFKGRRSFAGYPEDPSGRLSFAEPDCCITHKLARNSAVRSPRECAARENSPLLPAMLKFYGLQLN
jgi:hypothetical protein